MQAKSKPATDSQIKRILGRSDSDIIMAIQKTGASEEEVLQAFEWLDDDDHIGKDAKKRLTGNVLRVFDLLREERDSEGDERR